MYIYTKRILKPKNVVCIWDRVFDKKSKCGQLFTHMWLKLSTCYTQIVDKIKVWKTYSKWKHNYNIKKKWL